MTAEKAPRVLMVVGAYYPEHAGGGLQCRTLVQALRDRVRLSIFTTTADPTLARNSEVEGIPVRRIFINMQRPVTKLTGLLQMLLLSPALIGGHDILHFHGFTEKMLVLLIAAKLSGRTTICKLTSVGWDDPVALGLRPHGLMLAAGLARVDRVVAISPAMLSRCREAGLRDGVLQSIPNGVDTRRFRPVSREARQLLRERLGLPIGAAIVAFVGFWSREKGPDVLFEAWRHARIATGIDAALLYVGSTDSAHAEVDAGMVARIRKEVERGHFSDRVFFVNQTDDVASYLQAADMFAMPSAREGLSNALLEAMATGLPSVAAAISGVTDSVIVSGANGFIVPPGDVAALAGVLACLMRGCQSQGIGLRARQTIVDRFGIDAVADRYVRLYSELASSTLGTMRR